MATNRKLRTALLKRLKVSKQRLSQRVIEMKRQHGPMTTEEATYVIAHQEGFDLTKYLDGDTVDRVRGLVPSGAPTSLPPGRVVAKRASRSPQVTIRIAGQLPKVDALLPASIIQDADRMAKLYPYYYVLENSIRVVIRRILEKKHGKDWWHTRAPTHIQKTVKIRKAAEDKKPWHGRRGQHAIFYSDFGDLRAIIEKNWADFDDLFPNRPWITHMLDDLEPPRNTLAHHNPVAALDIKRFEVHFHDWTKLIASKKNIIP